MSPAIANTPVPTLWRPATATTAEVCEDRPVDTAAVDPDARTATVSAADTEPEADSAQCPKQPAKTQPCVPIPDPASIASDRPADPPLTGSAGHDLFPEPSR